MIVYQTGRDAVLDICEGILAYGQEVSPRGSLTKEVLGCQFAIQDPHDVVADGIGRKNLKPAIGALEALQNISGLSRPALFQQVVPASKRWGDNVATYAERLHASHQLEHVLMKLREDRDTREAVALIWGRDDLVNGQAPNLCTIGLQFLVRDDKLVCFCYMRSNDAWYGLCYDLFQFTQLQISIANTLGLEAGPYVHHATSMHLYERHFEVAGELREGEGLAGQPILGIGHFGMDWSEIKQRATAILMGATPSDETPAEAWYREQLAPYILAAQEEPTDA